ncbi:MAG: PAS domain-containing protein [Anaerolineae bacterium]|nr:PAS domain-containing protein [Anaerolineae bacterium]
MKTKSQLIEDLEAARARIAELEAALDEASLDQQLLQAFLDGIPDKVYFKDCESRFIRVSRALAEKHGVDGPEKVVGLTDFDFFTEEHARPALEDEQKVMHSGQTIEKEEKETWPDGRVTWASTSKMPLRDRKGDVIGTYGVSRDITEQKQIEAESARLQKELVDAQQRAIQELSTPIIPVMDVPGAGSIIVMPLIGSIDTLRARDLTRRLLEGIRLHRAKVVILDVTGVPIVDSGVASHMNKTIQAARLKGARTIVTGISDAVAETIIDLGLDWSGIETLGDLQTGLRVALRRLGIRMVMSP